MQHRAFQDFLAAVFSISLLFAFSRVAVNFMILIESRNRLVELACNTAADSKNNLLPLVVVGSRSTEIAKFYLLS